MPRQYEAQDAKTQLDTFLHVFGGADGGVSFANFKTAYEAIEQEALQGNTDAKVIRNKVQFVINLLQHFGGFDNAEL